MSGLKTATRRSRNQGREPFISDEQAKWAIDWLLEQPGRLDRKDFSICGDLEKELHIYASKTFWRKWVIGPPRKNAQINRAQLRTFRDL